MSQLTIDSIVDSPQLFFFVLFLITSAAVEIGYRISLRAQSSNDEDHREQVVSLRDGLMILLSLLIGFTFAMAVGRFEQRREFVVDDANAIGTTSLRAQMLPEPQRTRIAQLLQQYVARKAEFGRASIESDTLKIAHEDFARIQKQLWGEAIAVSVQEKSVITSLFIQALNETIDLDAKREAALENRIPVLIWILLTIVAILSCLSTGVCAKKRYWFPALVKPLMIAAVVALISDLDAPRRGYIRIGQGSMERLQQDMHR